jgi:hypothetical protein
MTQGDGDVATSIMSMSSCLSASSIMSIFCYFHTSWWWCSYKACEVFKYSELWSQQLKELRILPTFRDHSSMWILYEDISKFYKIAPITPVWKSNEATVIIQRSQWLTMIEQNTCYQMIIQSSIWASLCFNLICSSVHTVHICCLRQD